MNDKKCDLNVLGERIKIQRENLRMTQETLAERIGVARQTLAKWEINKGYPDLVVFTKLCEVFDCESGYLLGEYDFKKKDTADVGRLTGLSEDAVNNLVSLYGLSYPHESETQAILSYLLCVDISSRGDFLNSVIWCGLSTIYQQKIASLNRPVNIFERTAGKYSEDESPEERSEMLDIWEKMFFLKEKGFIVQDDKTALNDSIDRMLSEFKNVVLSSLDMMEELFHDNFIIPQKSVDVEQKRALISVYNAVKKNMDINDAEEVRLMKEDRERIARHKKEEQNG